MEQDNELIELQKAKLKAEIATTEHSYFRRVLLPVIIPSLVSIIGLFISAVVIFKSNLFESKANTLKAEEIHNQMLIDTYKLLQEKDKLSKEVNAFEYEKDTLQKHMDNLREQSSISKKLSKALLSLNQKLTLENSSQKENLEFGDITHELQKIKKLDKESYIHIDNLVQMVGDNKKYEAIVRDSLHTYMKKDSGYPYKFNTFNYLYFNSEIYDFRNEGGIVVDMTKKELFNCINKQLMFSISDSFAVIPDFLYSSLAWSKWSKEDRLKLMTLLLKFSYNNDQLAYNEYNQYLFLEIITRLSYWETDSVTYKLFEVSPGLFLDAVSQQLKFLNSARADDRLKPCEDLAILCPQTYIVYLFKTFSAVSEDGSFNLKQCFVDKSFMAGKHSFGYELYFLMDTIQKTRGIDTILRKVNLSPDPDGK